MKHETIANQPVIQTRRFALRPLQKSDAGLLELHASDARIANASRTIPHPLPPGITEDFIARVQAGESNQHVWIMDGSAQNHAELLGLVCLEDINGDQSEISYWVAPAFWNTGYASEAIHAILDANPDGCKSIFAQVFQDNPASARVLTNAGFEYIGDAETFSVARGANVATWTYIKKLD